MKRKNKQFILRLRFLFVGVVMIGFVLITNLFYIQVRQGSQFREQADNQYVVATYNSFERGTIYFQERDGERTSVAGQKSGYKVSINPSTLKDPEALYETLSTLTDIDEEEFLNAAEKKNRTYIEILHHVPKSLGKDIKEAAGSAVQLHNEKWRVYPLAGVASHVLGFLGYQGDEYAGRYGLERTYEDILKREDKDIYTNFFARVFHDAKQLVDQEPQEGNIVSTIDPQVQIFFERELAGIQEDWSSESVGGIIMNPKTGEVYALGAFPNFDNNDISQESLETFKNPLIEHVYEMGSIIKPLVVAIGLDTEVIQATTSYYDAGFVEVGQHIINNFDKKGRGTVDVQEVLNQSLNTGMVFIADKVSKQNFRDYFKKYGFDERTGIDLPNEVRGLTSNLKSNRQIEFANISFGQGIAVTPISVVRALSALANDGKTVTPHVVKKIEYTNGLSKTVEYPDTGTQVITPQTSEEISRMLVNVFDAYNNGSVKLPDYSIAAKTGTAQIPHPEGGYYEDRNLHSFFGYFPAYDPEFIVFLYTVHPKGVKYASQTLITPFRDTANYLINYYEIPPDR